MGNGDAPLTDNDDVTAFACWLSTSEQEQRRVENREGQGASGIPHPPALACVCLSESED